MTSIIRGEVTRRTRNKERYLQHIRLPTQRNMDQKAWIFHLDLPLIERVEIEAGSNYH